MEKLPFGTNTNVQNVVVSGAFDAATKAFTFNFPMNVDFIPDMITLKHVDACLNYSGTPTAYMHMYQIRTSLVNGILISLPFAPEFFVTAAAADAVQNLTLSQEYDIKFLNKSKAFINGNYSFQIIDALTGQSPTDGDPYIILSLHFEFIKF